MAKPKPILFYDRCRLCLENAGEISMFTKLDLAQDIFLCAGVQVSCQDNLPQKICTHCLETIVRAKQLRTLAMANETHLKSLFHDDDTFIISDMENNKTQDESNSVSRKSSTDSDRTIKLEIVEHHIVEEIYESNKKQTADTSKHSKSQSATEAQSVKEEISVRKDLFNSSEVVSSSNKDVKRNKSAPKVKVKRNKSENSYVMSYVCEVCDKNFYAWKKFYLHQKTHNRNIICPLDACEKKFATKGDLEKHIRTHTGERPYRCDICDKCFAQRVTLKSHKLNVHT